MSTAQQIQQLLEADSQTRFVHLQVFRNGSWIDIPTQSAKAQIGNSKAGKIDFVLPEDANDESRSQLYEGERVRVYRGILGAPPQRSWTGFVDTREPVRDGAQGVTRNVSVTDYIKELNDAIMLDGSVYDHWAPNDACIDVIQRAIKTQQFQPFDDNGNVLSSTANYATPGGNPLVYFPPIYNDDGSLFNLPSGTLGSYTGNPMTGGLATLQVPTASGMGNNVYSAFELPNRYVIASTMVMPGFTQVSLTAFPPARGQYILDAYNGLLYFNAGDASTTASFTCTYFDTPLFDFPSGTKMGDVISQILDKTGARWRVDGSGKLSMQYIDTIVAPKKIYNPSQYVSHGVQINRDRRNVIVCLGWDGNCGGILAAKAVNAEDINNQPPHGLGKRAYLVVQDQTWKTQYAVSKAVYYAVQQISRRGKVSALTVLDDPSLNLEDVLAFESTVPEIGTSDFFYVEGLTWNYQADGPQTQALMQITGTLLSGRGTIYLGPITGVTAYGSLDYSQDVEPIYNCALSPAGGSYSAEFSIASGLALTYTIGTFGGHESIDIYGSDGSHIVAESEIARAGSQLMSLPMPVNAMTPGVMYVFRLMFRDSNGAIGIYRDYITARA
jgi:hypothetical protein